MKYINLELEKYYHIFNRGNNKENIFREDQNYLHFMSLYKKYIYPVADTFAYCLMPNHFHFLIRMKGEKTSKVSETFEVLDRPVWKPFADFFNSYSKAFNKKYNHTGSLFQYKFKRNEVNTIEYLRELVIYIHRNPLSLAIDGNYQNYRYSSYPAIIRKGKTSICKDEVLSWFDTRENFIFCHNKSSVDDNFSALLRDV